jgi:2-hydroxycyclohexanecarboxyl-CoA dehydrogenase
VRMDLNLANKVALVTGGGLGIGRRISLTLANEGAVVVVNDLFAERAEAVAAEIVADGGRAIGFGADVTDYRQLEGGTDRALAEFGSIDILVNNAGVPPPADGESIGAIFVETDPEEWHRRMDVVTYGVMNACRLVVPQMIDSETGGKIVSVVSDAGIVGEARAAAYSFAKAGVIGFSKALAREVGKYKINVNCVSPGATMVEGGQKDRRGRDIDLERQDAFYQKILKAYPLGRGHGRAGIPSDVADPVVFLCSDRAVWITGAVLRASGGFSIA